MTVVHSRTVDGVLHLELSRPEKRNAISYETLAALEALLPEPGQHDLLGVVLSGDGGHFSAGADLRVLTGTARDQKFDDGMERVINRINSAPVPVIAAVSGSCMGAAVDLAMACDMRVSDASATFGVPAVHLGLLYNPRAITRMRRDIRSDVMHRLLVLAEVIGAAEAQSAGLVSVLTDIDPRDRAHQLIVEGADRDPDAVEQTRRLLRALSADAALDEKHWEEMRLRLLESPARLQRVTQARNQKGLN